MINNLLTMTCTIEKQIGNTFDSHRNPVVTWVTVGTNVPCYIHHFSETSILRTETSGWFGKNIHAGFFRSNQEIEIGYRVTTSYGKVLYVRTANIMFNPKVKTESHKECVLEVENV